MGPPLSNHVSPILSYSSFLSYKFILIITAVMILVGSTTVSHEIISSSRNSEDQIHVDVDIAQGGYAASHFSPRAWPFVYGDPVQGAIQQHI